MANVSKLKLNGVSYDIKDNNAREQLALIQNQFNQLIAPSGEAPNPAQIQNARIGADGVVYNTLGNAIRTQINNLNNIIINNSGGLSTDAKLALLACFQKVAWIDSQGQTYYDTLYDALFPTITSITAVFSQGSNTIYDTQTLEVLRQYLVVTANYNDSTEQIITNYELSGTLTAGTSVITVRYQGLITTFNVTVTHNAVSMTAVYTQSGTVYETDSLDSLKINLVVTYYADSQSAGVIVPSTDYTLSGTLTAGTSTITVTYLNTATTFNVNVTAIVNITASYAQQKILDIGSSLSLLNPDLTVTVEYNNGTVAEIQNYTLSGNLNTDGRNTITVTVNGTSVTDTFVVVCAPANRWVNNVMTLSSSYFKDCGINGNPPTYVNNSHGYRYSYVGNWIDFDPRYSYTFVITPSKTKTMQVAVNAVYQSGLSTYAKEDDSLGYTDTGWQSNGYVFNADGSVTDKSMLWFVTRISDNSVFGSVTVSATITRTLRG